MIFLPDTNACISLLRHKQPGLIARWQSTKATDIVLCSIVVYELRHGAESSSDPRREHAKLDVFLAPFSSLPFDDACAATCAEIRRALERKGGVIGPHDIQIAAIALRHDLTLVTHNTRRVFPNLGASIGRLGIIMRAVSRMFLDLTKLSEDDLIELNRRVVERLQFLRSAKSLAQLARLSVGMVVELDADDGRTISGTVARLNQPTATVVTTSGRWRVSPSLLRTTATPRATKTMAIGPTAAWISHHPKVGRRRTPGPPRNR